MILRGSFDKTFDLGILHSLKYKIKNLSYISLVDTALCDFSVVTKTGASDKAQPGVAGEPQNHFLSSPQVKHALQRCVGGASKAFPVSDPQLKYKLYFYLQIIKEILFIVTRANVVTYAHPQQT